MLAGASSPLNPKRLKHESQIEWRILEYLKAHPAAQDTVRGILDWWLLKQRIEESMAHVEAAVASLIAKGKLTAHTGPDGQVHYRIRRNEDRKRRGGNDNGMAG